MAGTYAPRSDGLLDITLDTGRRVPMAWSPEQAEAAGLYLEVAPEPAQQPPGAPQPTVGIVATPVNPAPSLADPFGIGAGQPAAPVNATDAAPPPPAPAPQPTRAPTAAEEAAGQSFAPQPKRDLVSIAPPGGAAPGAGGEVSPQEKVQALSRSFLAGELAPKGGGKGKPERDELQGFTRSFAAHPLDPETEEQLSESRVDTQIATQDVAEQREQAGQMQARLMGDFARQEAEREREWMAQENAMREDVNSRLKVVDERTRLARKLTDAGTPQERVWENKGWFGRIVATLGLALGNFGRLPEAGGVNPAAEALQEEIDNETEYQKQLLESEPERAGLQSSMAIFQDARVAEQELRLRLREQAMARAQAWAARADAESVMPEFAGWMATEAQKVAQERADLEQAIKGTVAEQWKHKQAQAGGPGRVDPLKAMQRAAQFSQAAGVVYGVPQGVRPQDALKQQQFASERAVRLPDGSWGYARTPVAADAAESVLSHSEAVEKGLAEIEGILDKNAGHELSVQDRDRVRAIATRNRFGIAQLFEAKQLTQDEAGVVDPITGIDANRLLKPDAAVRASIKQTLKIVRDVRKGKTLNLVRDPSSREPVETTTPSSFQGK